MASTSSQPRAPGSPTSSSGRPSHSLDLPSLHPLDHSHPLLSPASSSTFDPDAFLLSRLPAPLTDLRDELRSYQAQLKAELVELINLDYREFVELGTGLKGEGKRLERVRRPLTGIRQDVETVRTELLASEGRLREMLEQRAGLRDEKTLVQLLLSLTDSLSRTETLLDIVPGAAGVQGSAPAATNEPASAGKAGQPSLSLVIGAADSSKADPSSGSTGNGLGPSGIAAREKVVGRVAAEYTRVLYLSDKARKEGCALLDEVDWRIERIRNTLHRDLDHLFSDTLAAIARSTSTSAARERETLTECLKVYALVEGWRDAEDLYRREVVRPLVRKLISAGALDTPIESAQTLGHSSSSTALFAAALPPVTPVTPGAVVPATPMTPSTPFRPGITPQTPGGPSERNPFEDHLVQRGPRLEDQTAFGELYNRLLGALSKPEVTMVLQVASLLPVSTNGQASVDTSDDEGEDGAGAGSAVGKRGFDFFANVVWKEVGERLMDELGSVLFAAGRPSELHQHYTLTHEFFALLESLAPSPRSILAMRQTPTYKTFQARWGLGVYFQLRWKEIVLPLEEALAVTVVGNEKSSSKDGLHLSQTRATLKALEVGWDDAVFVPELAYRFWKLTLQILSRYQGLLATLVPPVSHPKVITNENAAADSAQTAEEDNNLRLATLLVREIGAFESKAWTIWDERIVDRVQSADDVREASYDDDDDGGSNPRDAYAISLSSLGALVEPLSRVLVSILARRCADSLRLVRSVASQYRSAGVKREPTAASYFVPTILKPLSDFFDRERGGLGGSVDAKYGASIRTAVVEDVAQSYTTVLAAVRESEEKLARLRKGKKTAFSLFGSSASAADEAKDAARIRAQMELDVLAFRKEADDVGVDVAGSAALQELVRAVGQDTEAAPATA